MSLKSLIAVAAAAALGGGCTCSGEPSGASGTEVASTETAAPADTELEPVPGIPGAAPRIGEAEEVMLFAGGTPRQIRRFEYPSFGADVFDVTFDLADGEGDDVQRQAQLALGVRARIEKALDRDGVRWSLEIVEATANDTEGVDAGMVARARELAPGLVGARAVIDNDRRGRWLSGEIERGTPSGRRAMAALLEAVETMRGLSYTSALGPSAEWGQRETRRWRHIEVRQTVQYTVTHVEDREMDYSISIKRNAAGVPAPGGGTVEALIAQGRGNATVRFDHMMPTGQIAIATTALIGPQARSATATGDEGDDSAKNDNQGREASGSDGEKSAGGATASDGTANQSGGKNEKSADGDDSAAGDGDRDESSERASESAGEDKSDAGKVVRKSKMQIAITARETSP